MLRNIDMQKAVEAIDKAQNVVVTTHMRPDGDACGSMMAIVRALQAMGKTVEPVLLSPLADWYSFLFDKKAAVLGNDISIEQMIDKYQDKCDLIIIVDTNSEVQLPGFADQAFCRLAVAAADDQAPVALPGIRRR